MNHLRPLFHGISLAALLLPVAFGTQANAQESEKCAGTLYVRYELSKLKGLDARNSIEKTTVIIAGQECGVIAMCCPQ